MEEIVVGEIIDVLKGVKNSRAKDLHILYDDVADVMYVNFGAPVSADDTEYGDDNVLYRYKDGKIIGLTLPNFSSR